MTPLPSHTDVEQFRLTGLSKDLLRLVQPQADA